MDQDLIASPVERMVCSSCRHELDVAGRPAFSSVLCPSCGTALRVPVMLGSFLLVERMGSGGMGAVYRALDVALNRFVAIKVMKAALGEDAKLVESFLREARAAAALNHRNIVQIYSCGQENGQPYIVMELVTGGRMSQLFTRAEPMDEVRLLTIALGVADGLAAAHSAGLVHGDIKPENILIDRGGTAKIVDFGLAQFVNAQKHRGEIWGTPYYISPERARGNKADHRSDLYSLGASMFHALTGQPPFDGETPTEVVLARLKHPPPEIKTLRPELTDQTVALINRMMAADPALRYPTSASLKSDLQAAHEAARAARSTQKKKRKAGPSSWPSRLIAAAAVGVLGAVGYWLFSAYRTPPPEPVAAPVRPPPREPADDLVRMTTVRGPDGVERPRMELAWFTPEQERALAAALAGLTGNDLMAVHRDLASVGRSLPREHARQGWIPLLQAVPLWAADDRKRATDDLARMLDRFKTSQPEEHPAHMPKVAAALLLGKLEAADAQARLDAWPAWFSDLLLFLSAVRQMAEGEVIRAARDFDLFLARDRGLPPWVAALKPAAARWSADLAAWSQLREQTGLLIAAGRAGEAQAQLEAFRVRAPLPLYNPIAEEIRRAGEAVRAVREQAEVEAQRQRRIDIQNDLRKVDEALAEISAMVMRTRDYRKASLSISTLPSDLKTPEGRQAAQVLRDQLDQLEALKTFLIRGTEVQPFTRADGSDLGGDVIGANSLGVRTTLDGRSVATRTWDGIPPRSLIRMAEYYAGSSRLTEAERAGGLTSLALFCVVNGAIETGQTYARQAIERDAGAAEPVRRLMPGLLDP